MNFKKTFLYLFIVGIAALVIAVIYFENAIDRVMDESCQEELFTEIDQTEPLPQNYIATINKYLPNYFQQGVWGAIFNQIINGKPSDQCPCGEIYLGGGCLNNSVKFAAGIAALELEDRFSQRQCYAYEMSTANFSGNVKGIRKAAQHYFNKEIQQLEVREILELHLIGKNGYYGRKEFKERLDLAIDKLMLLEK